MKNLSIPTDNFYKFLTVLGLASAIFSFSSPITLLEPHNNFMYESNLKKSILGADYGFLSSQIDDLERLLPDTVLKNVSFYFYAENDTSEHIKYYGLRYDSTLNKRLDVINKLYYEKAKAEFQSLSITETQKIKRKNNRLSRFSLEVLGWFSILITILGLVMWIKHQKSLDKKLLNEIKKVKEEASNEQRAKRQ